MQKKLEDGDRVVWPETDDAGTVRVEDGRALVRWDRNYGDAEVDEEPVDLLTGCLTAYGSEPVGGLVFVERVEAGR